MASVWGTCFGWGLAVFLCGLRRTTKLELPLSSAATSYLPCRRCWTMYLYLLLSKICYRTLCTRYLGHFAPDLLGDIKRQHARYRRSWKSISTHLDKYHVLCCNTFMMSFTFQGARPQLFPRSATSHHHRLRLSLLDDLHHTSLHY